MTGYKVNLLIYINQHSRDKALINLFENILECGYTFDHSSGNARVFSVTKFEDIYIKMIPLLKKYKIKGIKLMDFKDFCEAAELIKNKSHLTLNGLEKLRSIKSKMNKARYKNNIIC
jgi:hypothetical protein